MTQSPKQDFWQQHIDTWLQSKLTQKTYCQQNNIALASFSYWRTRFNRTATADKKLIPITIAQRVEAAQLFLPGGLRLEVPIHTLADVLPLVCRTIGAPPE